jgi:hypothetical protein
MHFLAFETQNRTVQREKSLDSFSRTRRQSLRKFGIKKNYFNLNPMKVWYFALNFTPLLLLSKSKKSTLEEFENKYFYRIASRCQRIIFFRSLRKRRLQFFSCQNMQTCFLRKHFKVTFLECSSVRRK